MIHEPVYWFGPEPFGPALPDNDGVPAIRVAAPIGWSCTYCEQPFQDNDSGLLHGIVEGTTPETLKARAGAVHRDCLLRQVLGPDADRMIARLQDG